MKWIIVLPCMVVAVLARKPNIPHDEPEPKITIDEAIMGAYKSHGIDPSNYKINNNRVAELDMVLTDQQYEEMYNHQNHGKTKRKAVHGEKYRWTNGVIPYEFSNDFTDHQIKEMKESMDVYMQETCLIFRPARPEDKNRIHMQQGAGCNSQLGMVGGTQEVNLDDAGCRWKGLYWHEIGHAIGLTHEHQLPDRDKYIRVRWENVAPNMRQWFKPRVDADVDRYGAPYDLTSVMHYGIHAFSQDGSQTIYTHDPTKENWIGRVYWKMLSFTDVKVVNAMYKCGAKCANVQCPSEGFVNKECQCVTPKSYYEKHCVNLHQNEEECYDWAKRGDCVTNTGWMSDNCRKACDRCPKFGMTFENKQGDCYNKYYDDMRCDKWAAAGDCERYPSFMKRYCGRSCKSCSEIGLCANTYENDFACDDFAKRGECEANPKWMLTQCADSCKACKLIKKGDCKNKHPSDAECDEWSLRGDCSDQKRMVWMKKNCASSCNSCWFGQGNCDNDEKDEDCDKWAAEAECDINPIWMKKHCRKSCNSCDFGKRGDCQNYIRDADCNYWADTGGCISTEGWLKLFCPSACNACDFWKNKGCVDLKEEDECKRWAASGQCDDNAGFMKYSCAKTCNSCPWLTTDEVCGDLYGSTCQFWDKKGECQNNPAWMKKNCKKTCGACKAGEREIPNTEPDLGCDNIARDDDCDMWAKRGECTSNPKWMKNNCAGSCKSCEGGLPDITTEKPKPTTKKPTTTMKPLRPECADGPDCQKWYEADRSNACNMEKVLLNCKTMCRTCKQDCVDENQSCAMWAKDGHCQANPSYMLRHCQKSCKYCR